MAEDEWQIEMSPSKNDMQEDYDMLDDIEKLPLELLNRISIGTAQCNPAKSITVLVTGRETAGKSSILSGIIGFNVNENEEQKRQREINGIKVTIWNSPGNSDSQKESLQQMKREGAQGDLIIYCIKLVETRFVQGKDNPDVRIMKNLTELFGEESWKSTIIALTYANTLEAFKVDWESLAPHEKEARFQQEIKRWKQQITKVLIEDVQIPPHIAQAIRIVPAGHHRKPHVIGSQYWLSSLWFQCVSTIHSPEVRLALATINMMRIKTENEVQEDDFLKLPQDQPIVLTNSSPNVFKTGVVKGVAGGAVGGGLLGMIGLVAGPVALAVSVPLGAAVGALLGGTVAHAMLKDRISK